jgi:DNA-binding CsgD family transcriptional regulator
VFEIVGREEELASLHAFISEVRGGPAALVVEGDAGIGKSTLWFAAVEDARAQGLRVLSAQPVEAESRLANAGLGDLFEGVLDDVLPDLSLPRRRALEVALLLEEASTERVDRRAVAVAVRDALELLSEPGPIVIAIDDVQWLDPSSSRALAFGLRRLGANQVLLLLARRDNDGADPSRLEEALDPERVQRLSMGPLSIGALHRFLRDRLGRTFARQTLLRIHERSGGNPFFALELGRVLEGELDPFQPLPVPATLEDLVRARLSGLPAESRAALALAAAFGTPSELLLERAGVASHALDQAAAAGVIDRDNGTIRFTHPLLSSVLYEDLGDEQRSVHGRIAEVLQDPLLRARHLALSTDTPDAKMAAALEVAARTAADRGASPAAAELAEHAVRLTPVEGRDERHRRALIAARAHHAAGEWTRARTIATELVAEADIGVLRAESLILLAELESTNRSADLLEEALLEASADPALRSTIQSRLAWAIRFREGFPSGLEHARAALELADDLDDDPLRVEALMRLASLGFTVGDVDAPAHAARAHAIATALEDEELLKAAGCGLVEDLVASGDLDGARVALEAEYEKWRDRDEPWSAMALWFLSWVELRAGRWELAADYAARAHDIAVQYGLEQPWDHLPIAWIAAHRGQLKLAQEHSERALTLAEEQLGLHPPIHLAVLGLVALWSGDVPTGAVWLGRADARAATLGWGEADDRQWTADYAEALLELGRIDDAVRVLDVWEADAVRLSRAWVLAQVTRSRGLVAAAKGAVAEAGSLLEQAVAQHEDVGDPFGRARALLALGIVRRRARQKRSARDAIRAALVSFEELGAATWAERARNELGTIGGRTRQEGLTTAERRVAALVADGRTNREVATALFLGERTVASHLTHIYAKLGIRSRTELARHLN